MTVVNGEDYANLHERALQFMGAFSSVQFAIDTVLTVYLNGLMPELGPALHKRFLKRVRDDQRLPLFKAFSTQVKYPGDPEISNISATFMIERSSLGTSWATR